MSAYDFPLDLWSDGWLTLECASILKNPLYIIMRNDEKHAKHYPVSREEMITYIRANGDPELLERCNRPNPLLG